MKSPFFFLCQMPQRIRVEMELRLLFSYSSSVYWESRSGILAIGKDSIFFHLFSPLTLRFWCGDVFLIKHGRINQSHRELYVRWWWCVWFYIAAHQINQPVKCYIKIVLLYIFRPLGTACKKMCKKSNFFCHYFVISQNPSKVLRIKFNLKNFNYFLFLKISYASLI